MIHTLEADGVQLQYGEWKILSDEPFSMLSPLWIELVKSWITEGKRNKGILLTDHLYHDVMEVSDQLYVLTNGKTHFINDRAQVEWLGYAKIS
jgi:ABC-type lipopolysaccharide export system ATPase subunit